MVARGDLGVECSLEQVPLIQKTLIRKTNAADKPVITATQMLESMINAPVPTRAEVSDVANAVFDGTDAVMLSAECATGDFPIETVEMMSSICRNAEAGARLLHGKEFTLYKRDKSDVFYGKKKHVSEFAHCIADAAVAASSEASAAAMIAFTTSSEMPIFCSKRRPVLPIIAVTPTPSIYRRLSLLYGIHPVLSDGLKLTTKFGSVSQLRHKGSDFEIPLVHQRVSSDSAGTDAGPKLRHTDTILALTERDILESPSAKRTSLKIGDAVVFCAGFHAPFPGLSNTIKMSRFGDAMRSERAHSMWSQSLARLDIPLVGITGFSEPLLQFKDSTAREFLEIDLKDAERPMFGDFIGSGICGGVASRLELERVGRNTLVGELPMEEVPDMGELQAEVGVLLGIVRLLPTSRRGGTGGGDLEDVLSGMKEGDTSFDRRVNAVAFSLWPSWDLSWHVEIGVGLLTFKIDRLLLSD
ncbi:UNVERIFIED_CONTAM: hypothetical protein HDU68_012231 [Siphonaria sp. JEL0065]|nr:hypothetical protein HDU68_012231 [Siphonaria sp. JEL0065]